MFKKIRMWLLVTSCFLIIPSLISCNKIEEKTKVITIRLAVFEDNSALQKEIVKFNSENTEYQIELTKYGDMDDLNNNALEQLKKDIMTKNGPDLINFGNYYSNSAVAGGYLEDLSAYFENDSELKEDNYFTNIVNAYCIGNQQYTIPISFSLQTLVGLSSEIGSRSSWNMNELMDCYQEKDDNMILYPGETKSDVFALICLASMEHYIDWETGNTKFDSDEFKELLAFCNQFPDELVIADDFSVSNTFLNGEALLLPSRLTEVYDIAVQKSVFGNNEVTYIGIPIDGANGTIIHSSDIIFGISKNSKNKSIAWQFLKQFLEKEFQQTITDSFPIYKEVMEEEIEQAYVINYTKDEKGNNIEVPRDYVLFEGEDKKPIYNIDQQQGETLLNLIEKAEQNGAYDYELYNILFEEAQSYFHGDKTVNEVTSNIQNRVSIYVLERIG